MSVAAAYQRINSDRNTKAPNGTVGFFAAEMAALQRTGLGTDTNP